MSGAHGHPPAPFYRSEVVRWTFVLTGAFLAWYFSPFGATGRGGLASLHLVHEVVPWPVIAVLFLTYALLLITGNVVCIVAADAIGLVAYIVELVALVYTFTHGQNRNAAGQSVPINGVTVVAFVLTCVLHYAALRLAVHQWSRQHRREGG